MTDTELAREAYLTLVSADDELPDNPKVDAAAHMLGDLWDRLRGPYCEVEGCGEPHLPSFPYCANPDHRRPVRDWLPAAPEGGTEG